MAPTPLSDAVFILGVVVYFASETLPSLALVMDTSENSGDHACKSIYQGAILEWNNEMEWDGKTAWIHYLDPALCSTYLGRNKVQRRSVFVRSLEVHGGVSFLSHSYDVSHLFPPERGLPS